MKNVLSLAVSKEINLVFMNREKKIFSTSLGVKTNVINKSLQ